MTSPDDAAGEAAGEATGQGAGRTERPAAQPKRGADLARAALARAKQDARVRSAATARRTRAGERDRLASDEGERPVGEPLAFGSAVRELLDQRGWNAEAAAAKVLANWESLVGQEIAAASKPVRLRHGELLVEAESTAWATQLRLLSRMILGRISAELGPDVVRKLVVRGPTAPDWRHGRLRVQGPGPRDTYG
jgi:predicted nucleic acid-binding Zn ribbon protein